MNNWNILGIEPTDDKNLIKEAYMERLSVVNPEDDPEGFKKLRNVYETLIEECGQARNKEDNSPLGLWIKKVEHVYENFSLRLNEENWQELLNDDICFSLDSREETSERLLTYLMDNFRLPQRIWILLNDNFEWTENKKELYEKFPYQFINYIENRVKYTDTLNYDLFEDIDDNEPYDEWIAGYYKLKEDINNWKLDEVQKDLDEILSINIYHPYLDIQKARLKMAKENVNEAFEIINPLLEKYPEDAVIVYEMAEIEYKQKEYEEAEKLYNKVLELLPDDYNASSGLADCRMELGNLEEAKDMYIALNRRNNYDNYIRQQIFEVNNRLIAKYESENAKDSASIFAHSWCLYENCRFKEILELLKDFVVPAEYENQYLDLMGRVNDGLDKHEESIESYNKWLEKLKVKYENNEEMDKTISALKYVYYQIGRQYMCLENYGVAIKNYDEVLKFDEENVNALDFKSRALIKLGKNDGALVTAEKGLEIDNRNVNLHITRAEALWELGYDRDALDAAIDAENIYPYAYRCYSLQMELYGSHGEVDNVLETYDRAEKYDAVDDTMKVLKVKALKEKKMYGEAEASAFKFLEDSKENNEEFEALDELYYEISCIYIETGKLEEGLEYSNRAIDISPEKTKFYYVRAYVYKALERYDDSIKDYDYIIKNDPKDTFAYEKEASIYKTLGKFDEALKMLFKILDLNPEHDYINNEIGEIYDSKDDYENALKYYTAQIELKSSAYYLVNRGLLYDRFNKTDEAIADYKKAIELEPDVPHAYNNLGLIYKSRRQFDEAIKCFENAIEKTGDLPFRQFYNNIGNTYTDLCKFEEALNYYNEGIKRLPKEPSLYLNKGKALSNLRRYEESLKAFEKGIKFENADLEEFYDEMADVYICIKKYDTAVKCYEKVVEINPQHLFAYRQMGDVYRDDIKDYDKAIQCYLKQIKVKDGNPKDFLALAQAYEKAGKKIRAHKYFKKALAIYEPRKEEEAYFKYKCAECYKGLKKLDVAFQYLNEAIEKPCLDCDRNGCYEAYYKMGQFYEEAENYEEAYKCYLKTYELCDNIEQYIDALDRIKKILNID